MPTTRSSTRAAGSSPSRPQEDKTPVKNGAGTKRKAGASNESPTSKRGKKATPKKKQKTIEETVPDENGDVPEDVQMKYGAGEGEAAEEKAEGESDLTE